MNRSDSQLPFRLRNPLVSTLVASLLIAGCGGEIDETPTEQSRNEIVGGALADIRTAPFTASLSTTGSAPYLCAAVILSDQWLLTAAHCIYNLAPASLSVRVGSSQHTSGGTVVAVSEKILHPRFVPLSFDNDIALIRLATRLRLSSSVWPAMLPARGADLPGGTKNSVFGWGTTSYVPGSVTYSPDLLKTNVKVVDRTACRTNWSSILTDNMICAGTEDKNICLGDDGGPLVDGLRLSGIANISTCNQARPSIFSRVGNFVLWIQLTTGIDFLDT